jgi:hypothetical protein
MTSPSSTRFTRAATRPATAVLLAAVVAVLAVAGWSSATGSSRTAAAPAAAPEDAGVVVAAAGDIVCAGQPQPEGACVHGATADAIAADPAIEAVLPLGDLQYECGELANFEAFYDPTWGRFRERSYPVPGNHEYRSGSECEPEAGPRAEGYFDYWNGVGEQTGRAGDRDRGYYSFDLGTWHVIALNSNCDDVGGCDETSPQGVWLAADLLAHSAECTLAYWHHPRFSSGEHGGTRDVEGFWRLLHAAGADVVLNGHDHDYERFAPQAPDGSPDPAGGIRQFVVGTGGKSLRNFTSEEPHVEAADASTFGVLRLTLGDGGYDWKFVPVAGGTYADSGSGDCVGGVPGADPAAPRRLTDLRWSRPAEAAGVTAYEVLRDGSVVHRTAGLETTWRDTDVGAGATHTYGIRAARDDGTASAPGAAVVVTIPAAGDGTTTVAVVAADARVAQASPDRNFGSSPVLRADGGDGPRVMTYFRGAVRALEGRVERAVLRVAATSPTADGPVLYAAEPRWDEEAITWSDRPPRGDPVGGGRSPVAAGDWIEFDVTPLVTGKGAYGFVLATTSSDGVDFSSKEGRAAPHLVVTTSP